MIFRGRFLLLEGQAYLLSGYRYYKIPPVQASLFDILEIRGEESNGEIIVEKAAVLASGKEPGGGENWKKALYDLELKRNFLKTSLWTAQARSFFWDRQFLEVHTPLLARFPAMEPAIDSFETSLFGETFYLHTSPEYLMKKMLVTGIMDRIFQIVPVFRKEKVTPRHNPEFLMLEWYRSYEGYENLMEDLGALVRHLAGSSTLTYQGREVDLSRYKVMTVEEAFIKYASVTFEELGVRDNRPGWEELYFAILTHDIEPHLGWECPVVLCEYPASMAALARLKPEDPRVAKRFEFYLCGVELANCFEELNSSEEQQKRMEEEKKMRQKEGKVVYDIDRGFLEALEIGLPPSSGGALGLERLFMILLDETTLDKALMFPWNDV
ncbi:MAG TPA: EF-P lysine aminoacylase EpmA [Candidatus Mcinerneyibacteriales bacterium]|nr:EF-P lysine aminoacylase EpmA [Candidatus Mcinerneyibacteriales bacterium]